MRNTFIIALILLNSFCALSLISPYQSLANVKQITPEQIAQLLNAPNRFVVNLGGKWEVSTDDKNWKTINIPGTIYNANKIYLRRAVKIDKSVIEKFNWEFLFLGVSDNIEIYVNEQFIGKFQAGMVPLNVPIPKRFLYSETNNIKFIITPADGLTGQIKTQNVFTKRIHTGILREVLLVGNPNVIIDNINYNTYNTTTKQNLWNVNTTISVKSADISEFITSNRITDSLNNLGINKTTFQIEGFIKNLTNGQTISGISPSIQEIESHRVIDLKFNFNVTSPLLWSPDNPNLYELVFTISKNGKIIDRHSIHMGFVNFSVRKDNGKSLLFVNGLKTIIKGVNYVEDFRDGKAISLERFERDVKFIKSNLGANLIKFKYEIPHPYMAQICSKYGLMMLIELPLNDAPQSLINVEEVKVNMYNIAERISYTYNKYPALLGWGIFDGIAASSTAQQNTTSYIASALRQMSKKLIYKTVRFGTPQVDTSNFDFIGFKDTRKYNSIFKIRDEISRLNQLAGNVPIFIEYGYPIEPNNHNGYSDPLSNEAQAYYIMSIYHEVRDKQLLGSIISTYRDYYLHNPLLIVNNEQQYLASSGLLDIFGKQRLSFNTLKSLFNNEKEPQISPGNYSESFPVSYTIIGLLLTAVIIFYVNRFKRFREYFFRAMLRPYNFFADIRDQRIISNIQTMILGLIIALTAGLYISSILYFYKTEAIMQLILLLVLPLNSVQELLYQLIWQPELLLISISLTIFFLFFPVAAIIRLFSLIVKNRIYFKDTITIVIWSSVPVLLLLPFTIILMKLLAFSPTVSWLVIAAVFIMTLWILYRIIKATAIVFDTKMIQTYAVGFSFVALLLLVILIIYQVELSIFHYSEFIFQSILY